MRFLLYLYLAELCGFYVVLRVNRKSRCSYCLLCCCVFDRGPVTDSILELSRNELCIRVFGFYLLQPDSL
jgi:hypothetical protein